MRPATTARRQIKKRQRGPGNRCSESVVGCFPETGAGPLRLLGSTPMKRSSPRSPSPDVPASPKPTSSAASVNERLEQELALHAVAPRPGTLARLQRYLDPHSGPELVAAHPSPVPSRRRKASRKPDGYGLFVVLPHSVPGRIGRPRRRRATR